MERLKLRIAAYLILIKEERVLLLRRFNTGWQDGNYSLPAGHLEPRETIGECLSREIEEEIGLKLKQESIELVHIMHRMYSGYIDFFFVSHYQGIDPLNKEPEKCDEFKWVSIIELPENIVPSVRFAIENYAKGITFSEFNNEG